MVMHSNISVHIVYNLSDLQIWGFANQQAKSMDIVPKTGECIFLGTVITYNVN